MRSALSQPFGAPDKGLSARLRRAVRAGMRLVFPSLTLLVILGAAYAQMEQGVLTLDYFPPQYWQWNPGYWLSVGHLVLPLAFFVVNMTNRKYGPGYAFAQVVVTWVLIGLITAYVMVRFGDLSTESPFPPAQTTTAFLAAFMIAQLVNIRSFDRTRGRTWWGAPFISIIWASAVYVAIFYPVSMMGMNESFVPRMVTDFTLKAVSAAVLLLPYQLMRKMIKPTSGYGGA